MFRVRGLFNPSSYLLASASVKNIRCLTQVQPNISMPLSKIKQPISHLTNARNLWYWSFNVEYSLEVISSEFSKQRSHLADVMNEWSREGGIEFKSVLETQYHVEAMRLINLASLSRLTNDSYILAVQNQQLVGILMHRDTQALGLAVHEEKRRTGIAVGLLAQWAMEVCPKINMMADAQKITIPEMTLQVENTNMSALRLYSKLGASFTPSQDAGYLWGVLRLDTVIAGCSAFLKNLCTA